MQLESSRLWRPLFVIGGILYVGGGSQHPRGEMVEMLADPVWFRAHIIVAVGLLVVTAGLVMFRRTQQPTSSLRQWLLFAVAATALETVEMVIHAMAYVDAEALALGRSTPVLITHAWLATLVYPVFAAAVIGIILAGQRERSVGSPLFGWLGIFGAAVHGIVMVPVFIFEIGPATVLFPVAVISLALWFILAGIWPMRAKEGSLAIEISEAV